jgi:hypothetical protein
MLSVVMHSVLIVVVHSVVTLSVAFYCYSEYRYAECQFLLLF